MNTAPSLIETGSPDWPESLSNIAGGETYNKFWTIGDQCILRLRLLAFFCSMRCPGAVILQVYDLARALRDAGVPVIGGFHSPMEQECLDLLLRGNQPIAICPARSIDRMRIPRPWRHGLAENQLLVISPFEGKYRRPTTALAERRNRFVAAIAAEIFVAHAEPGSKTEQLCQEFLEAGRRVWLLDGSANPQLCERGATPVTVADLVTHASPSFE